MSKRKVIAAQIGCGKFAYQQDLPNMTRSSRIDLKWVCDLDLDHARNTAAKFAVPHFTNDFLDIIRDPRVDMVKIATSHEAHLPIIEECARAGKHVFCEKPMAMNDVEACKIIHAVRRSGIKLCVDLNRRMAPAMQALRARYLAQCADPKHNPWRYVEKVRSRLPEENFPHMNIRIQDESSSYSLVHLNPLTGGGEIIGESVHFLDLACWFFAPALPVEITAFGSSRLSHGIHLKFNNGASMTLDFSCCGTFDYPKEQYEVTAEAALFRSLHFVENTYHGMPDAGRETFPLQADPFPEMGSGQESFIARYFANVKNQDAKQAELSTPLLPDKGHVNMLETFADAILEDRPSPCDEIAGFRATFLAQKAIESIRLKQTIPIQLEDITPCF